MRTIKFRGKNIETGEWVYGFYTRGGYVKEDGIVEVRHIIHSDILYDVEKHTIGQFTGLTDKNGVEIYEGDILHFSDGSQHVVMWDEYECGFNIVEYGIYLCEVIGNIYDNPELLKGE